MPVTGGDAITWGADFFQKVLISGLGTLGAFLIAVALFYWKRHYDKKDKEAKRQEEITWRLVEFLDANKHVGLEHPNSNQRLVNVSNVLLKANEFEYRISDPAIKSFLEDYRRVLYAVHMNTPPTEPELRSAFNVTFLAATSLAAYITTGEPLAPPDEDSKKPGPSEEETGPDA